MILQEIMYLLSKEDVEQSANIEREYKNNEEGHFNIKEIHCSYIRLSNSTTSLRGTTFRYIKVIRVERTTTNQRFIRCESCDESNLSERKGCKLIKEKSHS